MLAITLNPGFVLILAALLLLATPAAMRLPTMVAAGGAAMWLLLDHDFGAAAAVAQIGLPVVLLNLDALNQVFGIAFIAATILISIYASARRHAYEDAALMLLAGGAVSALFVGDLISFVAAASLAGLAAVWLVFASPFAGANAAGVRLLVWHGLEGLLFLAGVAFHISTGADRSVFQRLELNTIGGGFIFAALMIRVGAPLAHVWVKDVVGHASSAGAVALSVFSTMLGVYALARLFPAEAALLPVGGTMIILGAFFAASEDDLRRAAAYALMAQTGVCVALIAIASPLAQAGVAAHAFTIIFAFTLLLMALGAVALRQGSVRASELMGIASAMPLTACFVFIGGLAAAGAPGFGAYVSGAVAFEATSAWEYRAIWTLFVALPGVLLAAIALRPAVIAFAPSESRFPGGEAPFGMLLASGLAAFFCVAVGLTPAWLYRLTPSTALNFDPYAFDRLAPHLALMGGAGAAYLLLRALGAAPREKAVRLLDFDAFYRGPVAGAGRWSGVVMLRLYGAWQNAFAWLSARGGKTMSAWARACDQPYSDQWASAAQFAAIGVVIAIILLMRV